MDMELYNRLTDMADKDHYTGDDLDMIMLKKRRVRRFYPA